MIFTSNGNYTQARWRLANCYQAKGDIKDALNIYLELESEYEGKTNKDVLFQIANCYKKQKKYSKSNEYCKKIEKIIKSPNFNYLRLLAENYQEQNNYNMAEAYCKQAKDVASSEEELIEVAYIYNHINKNEDALELIKKVLETIPNVAEYWRMLGETYCYLFEWDLSINALKKADEMSDNDDKIKMALGRSYLLSRIDIIEAKKLLEKVAKGKSIAKSVSFGNLGHFYLIENNKDKALENYQKCIELLKDESDFAKKMDLDLKFMTKIGIQENDYNEIKDKVIMQYKLTKSKLK